MQPGLSRAIPLGILGFILGAMLVLVIRAMQSMDPVWSPQVGLVFGTLLCAALFVWGMGAFDPKMSVHGEGHDEEAHHEEAEAEAKPASILGGIGWQITALLVGLIVILAAISFPGFITLRTTADPIASPTQIGFIPVQVADLAHLVLLLITPVVLIGALLVVILIAIALLRPPKTPPANAVRYYAPRLLVVLVLFLVGTLLVPLWFDTVTPLRGPPQTIILFSVEEPFSYGVTRAINNTLVGLFGGATQIFVSELVFFIGFVAFMLISLLIVGGLLGLVFYALSRGLAQTKAEAAAKPAAPAAPTSSGSGTPTRVIARGARGLAKALRRLPNALQ
jgi:hypothetical protein